MMSLSGIGKGTYGVIREYMQEGVSGTLLQLQKEVPEGLVPLLKLPGLGGKKIAKLYQELGVHDAESLKEACEQRKSSGARRFRQKNGGENPPGSRRSRKTAGTVSDRLCAQHCFSN